MSLGHPLLGATVRAQIEHSASAHLGRPWASQGFISLDDRASHPCGILRGVPLSVFAKLGLAAGAREPADWRSIGYTLAALHQVAHERFGLDGPRGFFGPLPQDNRPVPVNRWADFFRERRLLPLLRAATDSGHLSAALAAAVEEIAARLPALAGPEPRPSLLHGDAQQNNFVSTAAGAVVIDAAPCGGCPLTSPSSP